MEQKYVVRFAVVLSCGCEPSNTQKRDLVENQIQTA